MLFPDVDSNSSHILGLGMVPSRMPGVRTAKSFEMYGLGALSGIALGQTDPATPSAAAQPKSVVVGDALFHAAATAGGVIGFMNSKNNWQKALFAVVGLGSIFRFGKRLMEVSK